MPGMSGLALQKFLIDKGHNLPMIFITAFPEETVRTSVLEAGAIAFLSKPFDGKTMIRCLGTALKGSGERPSEH
jgi:FixJ family two-component response regulator